MRPQDDELRERPPDERRLPDLRGEQDDPPELSRSRRGSRPRNAIASVRRSSSEPLSQFTWRGNLNEPKRNVREDKGLDHRRAAQKWRAARTTLPRQAGSLITRGDENACWVDGTYAKARLTPVTTAR